MTPPTHHGLLIMTPPPHHDSTHHDSIPHGSISHGLTCHDVQTTLLFASTRYKIDVVEWHQRTIDELMPVRAEADRIAEATR